MKASARWLGIPAIALAVAGTILFWQFLHPERVTEPADGSQNAVNQALPLPDAWHPLVRVEPSSANPEAVSDSARVGADLDGVILIRRASTTVEDLTGRLRNRATGAEYLWRITEGALTWAERLPAAEYEVLADDRVLVRPAILNHSAGPSVVAVFESMDCILEWWDGPSPWKEAFVSARNSTWSWAQEGRTDDYGRIQFAPPPGPTTVAAWTWPTDLQFLSVPASATDVKLLRFDLDRSLPTNTVVCKDAVTGLPIAGARLILGGRELPWVSDGEGRILLPARSAGAVVFAVRAAGYLDAIVDSSAPSSVAELQSCTATAVLVLDQDAQPVEGCRIRAGMADWVLTDAEGSARVSVPTVTTVPWLAYHPEAGWYAATRAPILQGSASVVIRLSPHQPLKFILEGASLSGAWDVEYTDFWGTTAHLRADAKTLVVPNPVGIRTVRLSSASREAAFVRSPGWREFDCMLELDAESSVSGALGVVAEECGDLVGRVVDVQGLAAPKVLIRLRPDTHMRRSEALRAWPALGGGRGTELPAWTRIDSEAPRIAVSDADGRIHFSSLPHGKYQIEFDSPTLDGPARAFGTFLDEYSFDLPIAGDLVVTMPDFTLLDLEIADETGGPFDGEWMLEITRSGFLRSGEVARHDGRGSGTSLWIARTPGARVRLSAQGFFPADIVLNAGMQSTASVRLLPCTQMMVEIVDRDGSAAIPPDLRIAAFRAATTDGFREYMGECEYRITSERRLAISAPFPGCTVLVESSDMESFLEYEPGATRTIRLRP